MKRFGLTGTPIEHSKSPALFQAAYGGRYPYDLILEPDFESSYNAFLEKYDGVNVTAPYKGDACARAQVLSHGCIVTGAANTLLKTGKGVEAWNTDIDGARGCLQEYFDIPVQEEGVCHKCGEGRTALVIGCGGAGKAAAFAAVLENFKVILINRNLLKAEVFARKLISMGKAAPGQIEAAGLEELEKRFQQADCLIYTIPAPLEELGGILDRDGLKCPEVIIEANYKDPVMRRWKELAIKRDIKICPGEKWLLHQGIACYRLFTGEEPDIEAMTKVL